MVVHCTWFLVIYSRRLLYICIANWFTSRNIRSLLVDEIGLIRYSCFFDFDRCLLCKASEKGIPETTARGQN